MAEIILKDCDLYYKPVGKEYQIIDGIHRLVAMHNVGDIKIANMAPPIFTIHHYRDLIVSELMDIGVDTWSVLRSVAFSEFGQLNEDKFKHAMWSLLKDGTIHRLPYDVNGERYVYGITEAGHERYD